jgi:hypothetical protein
VLNADQFSFNYEIASNRRLSHAEEKTTYLSVKYLNDITHSHTVMSIISVAGQLLGPVFNRLQVPMDRFPIPKRSLQRRI